MGKRFLILLFLMLPLLMQGQITGQPKKLGGTKEVKGADEFLNDSLRTDGRSTSNRKIKNLNAKIVDYKIISYKNDTTYVDTTLSIQKEYKFNYLRKDNFNLIQFSNIGQTYNTLSKDFSSINLTPKFGATSKHFNFIEIEDINYYHVPTPLTELMYKTAFEQGQLLDAFFTVNTSEQFNFSFAYKGLRSLGKYQHLLTSTGNFRFTTNYRTKNEKYKMRGHIVMQDILNEENGGLTDEEVEYFETGNEEYIDRSIFDMNYQNAQGELRGKRFHLEHSYALINQNDSLAVNELNILNTLSFEDKYYQFEQTSSNGIYGNSFESSSIFDKVKLEEFYTELGATYNNNVIGNLGFSFHYTNYNYGYNTLLNLNESNISNRLKNDVIGLKANYNKSFNKFAISGDLGLNLTGDFTGNYLIAQMEYSLNQANSIRVGINTNSKAPNYNYLLYQSDYINYNWQNNFDNIQANQISARINSKKIIDLSIDLTTIDNLTYFKKDIQSDEKLVKPFQNKSSIKYFRIKANREFHFKNFSLDNTIMFQEVSDDENSLNVPQIITRNTLYYSNSFFKKALYLQTGITLNYFTKYNMNAYDPVISEFYVQNDQEYGGFPRLDFFINAKVQQTRIFLKAEHFNSAWTGYDYYSAPNYPFRDFIVRFGLVWNFFL